MERLEDYIAFDLEFNQHRRSGARKRGIKGFNVCHGMAGP